MAHRRFAFPMPADAAIVFDAFHYHFWRARWDSLVQTTHVVGGAPCPFVGARTQSTGAGFLRSLAMCTEFVAFERPHLAAAAMVGQAFPFVRWAASMRHAPGREPQTSVLVYTYTFATGPAPLRWLLEPIVALVFDYQTRKRFARLADFLRDHAAEVIAWQQDQAQQEQSESNGNH